MMLRAHGWSIALTLCGCSEVSQPAASEAATSLQPAAADAACGGKTQPDCPLQGWMKSTMQPYQHDQDYLRLAAAFEKLAAAAPEGYTRWRETAEAGAAAAGKHDAAAVSQTCKSCHHDHRARFRKERRSVPLF